MVFGDSANLIKLGLDILFLISRSGSVGCYNKFRQMLEEKYDKKVRVHPMADMYEEIHVDTTISVVGYNKKLDKNLVVVDANYVTPYKIPAIFRGKNWAVIEIDKVVDEKADFPEAGSICISLPVAPSYAPPGFHEGVGMDWRPFSIPEL